MFGKVLFMFMTKKAILKLVMYGIQYVADNKIK